jgi:hypothetical protein
METRVGPMRVHRMLQLDGYVLLRITRIVKQDNFSGSLSNCQIVQMSFRKVGLKAIAIKNFFTPGKNTHAVGCCFQGNYFELIGPADRPAYLDNSPAGICTAQIIAIDITLRYGQILPSVIGKRIKAQTPTAWICQHDAYVGWTIVSRTEHNVEFAQGRTITSIVGIEFVKDVANARISQAWDMHEISVAPGRPRDDHHEQCEYLCNSAIQHGASHAWQVMQRRLTGYIAFGATFRVRPILQLSAPGSKKHSTSIAGRRPHSAPRGSE